VNRLLERAQLTVVSAQPIVQITPNRAGWSYIGFAVYRLVEGDVIQLSGEENETAIIVLEGSCDLLIDDLSFPSVGSRDSVFDDKAPETVYSPPAKSIRIVALRRSEVAVAKARCERGVGQARLIRSQDMPTEHRGSGTTERHIRHILDENHAAEKLLLVEVVTPAGNWSSFPPHKHDEDRPGKETYLEETYYYRMSPGHGQAIQRVYDKQDMDEVLTARDGDVVLVPKGYHPVAAIPGFTTYYLNVMAGHERSWKYTVDSDYAHVTPIGGNITGVISKE